MQKVRILNTELVAATQTELLDKLRQGVVVTPNIDHLVKLQHDRELYELYQKTEWVICDSRLLYLFAKLLPQQLPQAIPGSSFFPAFYMYHRQDEDCRLFLLGGMDDVAQKAMENINRKVGRPIVVGAYSPSFGFDNKPEENERIVNMIRESGATVVPVCVGCPKQEKWIAAHRGELVCGAALAVGGLLDFVSERIPRAPVWMRRMGIEWCYRLYQEPRRMFRRYVLGNPLFLFRLIFRRG